RLQAATPSARSTCASHPASTRADTPRPSDADRCAPTARTPPRRTRQAGPAHAPAPASKAPSRPFSTPATTTLPSRASPPTPRSLHEPNGALLVDALQEGEDALREQCRRLLVVVGAAAVGE